MTVFRIAVRLPLLVATLLLGACAAKSFCVQPQRYDHVASIPPMTATDGLNIPNSPTALKVPPPPAQDVPFGNRLVDPTHPGKLEYACLDEPPPMPAGADPTLGSSP
jgi:hypothetical protein